MTLLWPRMRSVLNTATPRFILTRSPFMLVAIGLWVAVFKGTETVLGFLNEIGPMGDMVAMKLMAMLFFSLSGFLLLSNIITSISACYLSRDLNLLLTRPVPIRSLLWAKSIEAAINANWMPLVFTPAILIPYALVYDAPWTFYALVLPLLVPFVLIPSGLGASTGHVLTRIFPVRKTRDALLGLGLLLFVGAYFVLQSSGTGRTDSVEGIISLLLRIRTDSPMLPGYWMTNITVSQLRGMQADWLFPMLVLTTGLFFTVLSLAIGSQFYASNLFRLSGGSSRTALRPPATYPGHARAFLWKDARLFFRDTEQWSQLVIISALLMIYVYNFKVLPVKAFASITPMFAEVAALFNVLLAGLVLTAVAARFLYVAVSAEAGAFWVVMTSPVSMRTFLLNKFLYGFIPIAGTVLTLVLLSGTLMSSPLPLTLMSLGVVFVLSVSICAMAAGMGASSPKFNFESLASLSIGMGSVGFMVMAFCLVLISSALVGWSVYEYKTGAALIWTVTGLAVMLGLNALATLIPMRAGIRKLRSGISELI
ncbi:hypothetical protein ACFLZI_00205 [Nitrospirota bacterium]